MNLEVTLERTYIWMAIVLQTMGSLLLGSGALWLVHALAASSLPTANVALVGLALTVRAVHLLAWPNTSQLLLLS